MNPRVQEFLDQPDRLERELVGAHLDAVLRDLGGVPPVPEPGGDPTCAVRTLLGSHLPQVLQAGLKPLPLPLLEQLLREPALLLQLQELVLCAGGPHWQRLVPTSNSTGPLPQASYQQALRWSGQMAQPSRTRRLIALVGAVFALLAVIGVVVIAEQRITRIEQTRSQEVAQLQRRLSQVEEELRQRKLNPFDDPALKAEDLCRSFALTLGLPPMELAALTDISTEPPSEGQLEVPVVRPHHAAQKRLLEQLQNDASVREELMRRSQYYLNHPDLSVQQGARLGLSYSRQLVSAQTRDAP